MHLPVLGEPYVSNTLSLVGVDGYLVLPQVDGLGDGAMIEVPGEDLDFLRTTSFGLLQVTITGGSSFVVNVLVATVCGMF